MRRETAKDCTDVGHAECVAESSPHTAAACSLGLQYSTQRTWDALYSKILSPPRSGNPTSISEATSTSRVHKRHPIITTLQIVKSDDP